MICTYLCNIRMNGVFKPNRNQIWNRIENEKWYELYIYVHAIFIEQVIAKGLEKRNKILCPTNKYTFTVLFGWWFYEPVG